ncbi:MAG: UPF0175 family protein [Candidatus Asgardarchaeia archaeon]
MSKILNVRVNKKLIEELDKIAEEEMTDRASVARKLLMEGIRRRKIERAIQLYRKGLISLERAAEIAEVSIWEMIEFKNELKVPDTSDEHDVLESIIAILEKRGYKDISKILSEEKTKTTS